MWIKKRYLKKNGGIKRMREKLGKELKKKGKDKNQQNFEKKMEDTV